MNSTRSTKHIIALIVCIYSTTSAALSHNDQHSADTIGTASHSAVTQAAKPSGLYRKTKWRRKSARTMKRVVYTAALLTVLAGGIAGLNAYHARQQSQPSTPTISPPPSLELGTVFPQVHPLAPRPDGPASAKADSDLPDHTPEPANNEHSAALTLATPDAVVPSRPHSDDGPQYAGAGSGRSDDTPEPTSEGYSASGHSELQTPENEFLKLSVPELVRFSLQHSIPFVELIAATPEDTYKTRGPQEFSTTLAPPRLPHKKYSKYEQKYALTEQYILIKTIF
jgi:hypothetical protein